MSEKYSNKECYDRVVSGSEEIIKYVDELKQNGNDMNRVEAPDIIKVFYNPDDKKISSKKDEVIKLAETMGGSGSAIAYATVAPSLISNSGGLVGLSGTASTMATLGVLGGGAIGKGVGVGLLAKGLGAAILPFSPLFGGAIAVAGVIWGTKQRKQAKPIVDKLNGARGNVEEMMGKLVSGHTELLAQEDILFDKIKEKYLLKDFIQKAKKKVDDVIFTNRNKNLMQYQNIALNQYADIKNLTSTLDEIKDKYNDVLSEYKELESSHEEVLNDMNILIKNCEELKKEKQKLSEDLEKCMKLLNAIDSHRDYLLR